jgi:hypothetical protein
VFSLVPPFWLFLVGQPIISIAAKFPMVGENIFSSITIGEQVNLVYEVAIFGVLTSDRLWPRLCENPKPEISSGK